MRFRVTLKEYEGGLWCAQLEENRQMFDGAQWEMAANNHAHDRALALDGLKRGQTREHEERMRAIEAAQ